MKKKKVAKEKEPSLSKLEAEVAKTNPSFVKWLKAKSGKKEKK